ASAGSGMSSISDETFLLQNVAIVRFDGTMTLGGLPIGGGENLINKYGIRAQSLPPTNIYLPGNPTTDGAQNKLLRATIAQYAIMKAEAVNDIARHTGTVTAIEDSAFKIGQPMIYEPRLRD